MSESELPEILQTDYELGDEYDDVPRFEDLSDEEKAERTSLDSDFTLVAALQAGAVPPVGTTIEKQCEGQDKAEALGRAYHTRDLIREAGGECEVEYIEPEIVIGGALYHTVEITVTETASVGGD